MPGIHLQCFDGFIVDHDGMEPGRRVEEVAVAKRALLIALRRVELDADREGWLEQEAFLALIGNALHGQTVELGQIGVGKRGDKLHRVGCELTLKGQHPTVVLPCHVAQLQEVVAIVHEVDVERRFCGQCRIGGNKRHISREPIAPLALFNRRLKGHFARVVGCVERLVAVGPIESRFVLLCIEHCLNAALAVVNGIFLFVHGSLIDVQRSHFGQTMVIAVNHHDFIDAKGYLEAFLILNEDDVLSREARNLSAPRFVQEAHCISFFHCLINGFMGCVG